MKKARFLAVGLFFMLMAISSLSVAQSSNYSTSLGLRLSPFYGFTVKHFLSSTDAVEGILHSRWNAFKITGLYERHLPAFDEPGLSFYYGGGAHIGVVNDRYYDRDYDTGHAILGIDGILGFEFNVQAVEPSIPLNASIDWKPVIGFAPFFNFYGTELALSVRYIIN